MWALTKKARRAGSGKEERSSSDPPPHTPHPSITTLHADRLLDQSSNSSAAGSFSVRQSAPHHGLSWHPTLRRLILSTIIAHTTGAQQMLANIESNFHHARVPIFDALLLRVGALSYTRQRSHSGPGALVAKYFHFECCVLPKNYVDVRPDCTS